MSTTLYAYDLRGNIVKKTLGNGLVEKRTYDGRNRVTTLKNQTADGTDIAGYAYSYDRAGNVMQIVEDYPDGSLPGRTITNKYDGVHRLIQEQIVTTGGGTVTTDYTYDKSHNRTSKTVNGVTTTYVIGNGNNGAGANQIVSETTDGVTTYYTYDANGNRSTRTIGGNTDTYTYDDENRLIGIDYQTGTSSTGPYAYAYDYRTRRITRTEPGPVTTLIVFDGGTSIEEFTSSAASPTVEYVRGHDYGGGVGGLEYSIRSGVPHFNFYDSRGDVTTQTDSNGAVTFQTAYEAFGNQTATDGSTLDRQKASTKEQDPTGLLNEGMRYRDPGTGTFLTRDPLGFKAGPNMYTYARQNPWTHFDPQGLLDTGQFAHDFGHQLYQNWGGLGIGFYNAISPIGTGIALAISQNPSKILGDISSGAHYLAGQIASSATAIAQHPNLVPAAANNFAGSFNQDGSYGRFIGGGAAMLPGVGIKAPLTGPTASSASDQALLSNLIKQRVADSAPGKATYAQAAVGDQMTPVRQSIPDPGGNSSRDIHAEKQVVSDLSGQQKPVTVAVDQHPCGNCGPMLQNNLPPGSRVVVPDSADAPGSITPKSAAVKAAEGKISGVVPKTVMSVPPTRSSTSVPVPSASTKQNNDRH